jgi:hypothetical protein
LNKTADSKGVDSKLGEVKASDADIEDVDSQA